jgi:hypothetical protein
MLQVQQSEQFETAPVVVETGQVLGSLSWNIQRWVGGFFNETSSTIVRCANCQEGASADFSSALEQFYGSDGLVVVDGFAAGSAELPATHQQRLAPILARLPTSRPESKCRGGHAGRGELGCPFTGSGGEASILSCRPGNRGIAHRCRGLRQRLGSISLSESGQRACRPASAGQNLLNAGGPMTSS